MVGAVSTARDAPDRTGRFDAVVATRGVLMRKGQLIAVCLHCRRTVEEGHAPRCAVVKIPGADPFMLQEVDRGELPDGWNTDYEMAYIVFRRDEYRERATVPSQDLIAATRLADAAGQLLDAAHPTTRRRYGGQVVECRDAEESYFWELGEALTVWRRAREARAER